MSGEKTLVTPPAVTVPDRESALEGAMPQGPTSRTRSLNDRGATTPPGLTGDWDRIHAMLRFVRDHTTAGALSAVLPPSAHPTVRDILTRHTRFDHGALLVFADPPESALADLAERGLQARALVPSTVVRSRLAERYAVPAEELPVMITHVNVPKATEHALELFVLSALNMTARRIIDDERANQYEAHLAFRVTDPDERLLELVWDAIARQLRFTADGSGFNPHQGPSGCTVTYFQGPGRLPLPYGWPRRLEIIADGHHPKILRRHRRLMMSIS
ncbi:hypothetical protein ABT186_43585 [Streptomyces sp. NPDC001634]|uniref:hypothetical protein n=1 Tax=Streptomyces sp. NPDC001634 TaxID=3154390 RepID=UPI00331E15E6